MRNKYRLAFEKRGPICFLGHLDLLKVFQRSVRRAGLPIAYSNGFNPHQLMSFALPLPLGMESGREYLDIELAEPVTEEIIVDALNQSLPMGIKLLEAKSLMENEKSAAAILSRAAYIAELPFDTKIHTQLEDVLKQILAAETLMVDKKTKSGIQSADIRPDIYELANHSQGINICIRMILSAGSARNLKPDVVCEYIYKSIGIDYNPFKINYVRELILA